MRLVSVLRNNSSWSLSLHKSLNPISVTYVLLASLVSLLFLSLRPCCTPAVRGELILLSVQAQTDSLTHIHKHTFSQSAIL